MLSFFLGIQYVAFSNKKRIETDGIFLIIGEIITFHQLT